MKHIGIDGCKGGWFVISIARDGSVTYGVYHHINDLSSCLTSAEKVLIDIPIGLRGAQPEERLCDRQARAVLTPKRSASVFPAPSRCALGSQTFAEACEKNRTCSGKGLTIQTFGILPKIREVDQLLQAESSMRGRVREMHPEICFWALNHRQAMRFNKKTQEGFEERITLLSVYVSDSRQIVASAMGDYKRADLARDDIVDALVGAITARQDTLQHFPDKPETDETGLTMEIVYWEP